MNDGKRLTEMQLIGERLYSPRPYSVSKSGLLRNLLFKRRVVFKGPDYGVGTEIRYRPPRYR